MDNKQLYRDICSRHADVPVFLQPWWLDAACPGWQAAIAKKGEHITGIWPYNIDKRLGVNILRTPLLTPYFGPHVFFPADIKESNKDGFEHDTTSVLLSQLPVVPVWELSMQPGLKQAGLFKNHSLEAVVRQTFLINLQRDENVVFGDLKESLRRNIKAAAKEITIVDDASCLPQLYQYQQQTLARKNAAQPHTQVYMQQLMTACIANKAGALWVAKKGDEIQAIVWNVWDVHTSYYLVGAQNPAASNYTAMAALLWQCMVHALQRGNHVFDLEGSMDPGVEKFFRGFGGKRELYIVLKKNTSPLWKIVQLLRK